MLNSYSLRLASFAISLGVGVTGVLAPLAAPVALARSSDPIHLNLRQVNGRVDVVIAGLGPDGKVGRERSNEALVSVGTQLVTSYEVKQD